MALSTNKVLRYPVAADQTANLNRQANICSIAKSAQNSLHHRSQGVSLRRQSNGNYRDSSLSPHYSDSLWGMCRGPIGCIISRRASILCHMTKERIRETGDLADITGEGSEEKDVQKSAESQELTTPTQGLAEAYKYVYNDAKFVNERARNDIVLLSRGILSLDARARQDVAILGSELFKLDARAREDTEKIDHNVKKKAERLHHIATILKNKAKSRLKTVADRHWNDGALEADLRRADIRAKTRAMEDTLMAMEFVKNIHNMMVSKMYHFPLRRKNGPGSQNITLEKNGKALDFFSGEISNDRITAIQEAYWEMAYALSEADGIDYTDPEELEMLITTLIDLDAMDGKSSVSLLAECSSSPDVNTRQALANALAAAPSMWTLGNAGMGALQRLAEDSDPAVAAAASRAIYELKQQWEIEDGDSWRFMLNQRFTQEDDGETS